MKRYVFSWLAALLVIGCGDSDSADTDTETAGDPTTTDDTDSDSDTETVPEHPLQAVTITKSSEISTVAILEWKEDLGDIKTDDIEEAYIEFGLGDALDKTFPINIEVENMRTVLLGMKAGMLTYSIRTTVVVDGESYVSPAYQFETGFAPTDAPVGSEEYRHASKPVEDGYILMGAYTNLYAFIIDTEGDLVWWTEGVNQGDMFTGTSDVVMDWSGQYIYMIATNPAREDGAVIRRVSVDGQETENFPAGRAHHSLKAAPEGGVFFIQSAEDEIDAVMYMNEAGKISEVFKWTDVIPFTAATHSNFLGYDAEADAFFLSSRDYDTAAYVTRDGKLVWSLGRDDYQTVESEDFPMGTEHDIIALHGMFAWNSGKDLLLFNNVGTEDSNIFHYALNDDFDAADTAWTYSRNGAYSNTLGGVQRLPGGNTQIVYSNSGVINQIDDDMEVVHRIDFNGINSVGYGNWRPNLYGPPPQL